MKKNKELIISLCTFSLFLFLTVGYAILTKDLGIKGLANVSKVGNVHIDSILLDSSATDTLSKFGSVIYDENTHQISLDYDFTLSNTDKTYESTYLVYIKNDSVFDYTFTGLALNPEVKVSNESAGGATVSYNYDVNNKNSDLEVGQIIKVGETRCVAIVLSIHVGAQGSNINIKVNGSGSVSTQIDNSGTITASLESESVDLRNGKDFDCFKVRVINSFTYQRTFNLSSSNKNFALVDNLGNDLSYFTIDAASDLDSNISDQNYEVCIKTLEGSIFLEETASIPIVLDSSDLNIVVGDLTAYVDITDDAEEDTMPPVIENVQFSINTYNQTDSNLLLDVSWDRTDTGGTDVINYYVNLYDETNSNQLIAQYETGSSVENLNITMDKTFLSEHYENMVTNKHNYYVKVYGQDLQNTGADYCSNENNSYCVKSASINLKWEFSVVTSFSNISLASTAPTKAYINNIYSADLTTPSTSYNMPSDLKVYMGDSTNEENLLTINKGYNYSASGSGEQDGNGIISGSFSTIVPVTDDLTLSGTASYSFVCLVEGTKVLLANGEYKNIEDIEYNDLLMVMSHDTGELVYEYPIWIEKKGTTSDYQRITFSDGTILETVGTHGIFSKDLNKYVSVLNEKEFHVGSNVVKVKDNKVEIVKVIKIEKKTNKVNYYHVASTRYHNIISNNILTTDALLIISNMFKFNENLSWASDREEYLKSKDFFYYKDWGHMFPKHLFIGFRMEEAKILYNKNELDILMFDKVLNQLIEEPPKSNNNKNLWMVTTSDDLKNLNNGVVLEEDSYYKLKEPINVENKKFVGWYNTSDNKYYYPGDEIIVNHGMYFEAIWK